jgi:beta-galactosidase/beta-glucuronidase
VLCLGRLYLHFEGINSAAYVWANGQLLGYSQDSCLPAEFEATHALRPGRNLVTVQVLRLSYAAAFAAHCRDCDPALAPGTGVACF